MSTITADQRVSQAVRERSDLFRKLLKWGGFGAGAVLVAFGVVAIIMGFSGRATVANSLKLEKIVGSADMTPALIAKEAKDAGLVALDLPTVAVAGETINSGPRARAFASYMRIHALEATGGFTYARWVASRPSRTRPRQTLPSVAELTMPRQPWSIRNEAARRERHPEPLGDGNGADHRAEHLVHGRQTRPVRNRRRIALLLSGIGFIILAFAALHRPRVAAPSS